MALRNPTTAPRIVPQGAKRLASDKLSNGRPAFAVTQSFANPSGPNGSKHGALDLGNFNCGDQLLASVAGTVRNKRDAWGALIVEVVESSGALVGYAHFSKFAQTHGAKVARGAVLGYNGTTGNSTGCHCHYYRKSASGVLQDPWPQLEQNQTKKAKFNNVTGPVNIRTAAGTYGTTQMGAIYGAIKSGVITRKDGTVIQRGVTTSTQFTAKAPVRGATHGLGTYPYWWTPMWIGGAYRYVATPLISYA
jgi:hypothetical protein